MGFERRLALRYLRSKRRYRFVSAITLLAGMGVAVGVMAMLITLGVMDGFEQDLKEKLLGNMAPIALTARNLQLKDVEPVRQQLASIPEIRGLSPYIRTQILLVAGGRPFGATLMGMDPRMIPVVSSLPGQMQEGSLDALNHLSDREPGTIPACKDKSAILLGRELASNLAVFYGDTIRLISPVGIETPFGIVPVQNTYCVGGIFETGLYEYDAAYVYMSLEEAQRFLHLGDDITGIDVGIDDFSEARRVAEEIRGHAGGSFRVEDWMQKNRRLLSAMRLEKHTAFGVLVLIVLVAVLSILSSLAMTVIEKKQEIAILKALGATKRRILGLFVLQGLFIGTTGTVVGAAAGFGVCRILERYPVVSLPQDVFYHLTLPVKLGIPDIVYVCLATLVLSLLATLYPAWKAAGVPPAQTLRNA